MTFSLFFFFVSALKYRIRNKLASHVSFHTSRIHNHSHSSLYVTCYGWIDSLNALSTEVDNFSVGRETTSCLCNVTVYHFGHKCPPLHLNLTQINPAHSLTLYIWYILILSPHLHLGPEIVPFFEGLQ